MDDLPCPDFEGLPLDSYDGFREDGANLTYEMSRGCYWSKCAYCVDLPLPKPSYRTKSACRVVKDIRELTGTPQGGQSHARRPRHVPAPHARGFQGDDRRRRQGRLVVHGQARPGFNAGIFRTAARAGLRQINFGFESANDRVCRSVCKGNERARSQRVIRECARGGHRGQPADHDRTAGRELR